MHAPETYVLHELSHECRIQTHPQAVCNVIRLLVYYGASPTARNFMGRTPLHMATEQGSAQACRCLLQQGGDLNATDKDGWSARQLAEFLGHAEVGKVFVDVLCERGSGLGAVVPTSLPPPNYRNSMFKVFDHINLIKRYLPFL